MHASDLSLDEKTQLLTGGDFWHTAAIPGKVPALRLSDGPHGLRKQKPGASGTDPNASYPATCYPTASALACSFDESLIERVGTALGQECRANGVDVLLGPGVNMKRDPRCGRNFEYFSEDPLLAGKLGAAYIRGVQSQNVGACLKHLAGNSQERKRMVSDSIIDERALHELYLPAFEIAIKQGRPWMLMPAYNRLNGTYCCENTRLIDLARKWGFTGVVASDWGAMSDSVASVAAGLSLCMPGPRPDHVVKIRQAIAEGELTEEQIDACVSPLLSLIDWAKPAEPSAEPPDRPTPSAVHDADADPENRATETQQVHWHALAQEAAEQSAVLLQNQDSLLPLNRQNDIAVIGSYAAFPRFQGQGSSQVNARRVDTPLEAMKQACPGLCYAPAYDPLTGEANKEQMVEAARIARDAQTVVAFLGQAPDSESEGYDRAEFTLPASQVELLRALHAVNPNVVVILQCGSPVDLSWRTDAKAILLPYLGGEACGSAVARLLFGDVCPSGKLAETWPKQLADTPCGTDGFPDHSDRVFYRESLFTGYRWYDAAQIDVAFPFGFGLSYTHFAYRDMHICQNEDDIQVRFTLKNSGTCDGAEVVQLYLAPQSRSVFHPPQTLAAFCKVHLKAGTETTVNLSVDRRAFSFYDSAAHCWVKDPGDYEVRLGSSSRDVRLHQTMTIPGKPYTLNETVAPAQLAPYHHVSPGGFSDTAFAHLLGHPLPERMRPLTPLTIDSPVTDLDQQVIGQLVLRIIRWVGTKIAGGGPQAAAMLDHMLEEVPLRAGMTEDFIDMSRIEALVCFLNHEGGVVKALRNNYSKRLS